MKSVPVREGCSGPMSAVALKEPVLVRRFLRTVGRWARISGLRQLTRDTVVPKSHGALGDVLRHLGGEEEQFLLDGVEGFVEVLSGRPEQAVAATEGVGGDAEVVREACDADGAAGALLLPYREPDRHRKPSGVPAVGATGRLICAFTRRCRHGSILFVLNLHPLTLACRDLPSSGDKLKVRDDDPIA